MKESDLDLQNLSGVPDMSYGWSKLTGEYLAKLAHDNYGLDIVCYRPFSGYGEDQHETYPFIAILKRIIKGDTPIEIWSNSVRDFVYIEDIVDCVLTTMYKVHDGSAINIASGVATSFIELVKEMLNVVGCAAEVKIVDDKPKGVYYRVGDPSYVMSLGWFPKTSLQDIIPKCCTFLSGKQ